MTTKTIQRNKEDRKITFDDLPSLISVAVEKASEGKLDTQAPNKEELESILAESTGVTTDEARRIITEYESKIGELPVQKENSLSNGLSKVSNALYGVGAYVANSICEHLYLTGAVCGLAAMVGGLEYLNPVLFGLGTFGFGISATAGLAEEVDQSDKEGFCCVGSLVTLIATLASVLIMYNSSMYALNTFNSRIDDIAKEELSVTEKDAKTKLAVCDFVKSNSNTGTSFVLTGTDYYSTLSKLGYNVVDGAKIIRAISHNVSGWPEARTLEAEAITYITQLKAKNVSVDVGVLYLDHVASTLNIQQKDATTIVDGAIKLL